MHLAKSLAIALTMVGLASAPALAGDPTGNWQSNTGESRYNVTYCGDGAQICAKLTWLREDAQTKDNLALLNSYVVKGAVPAGEDSWEGNLAYEGDVYAGQVTMVSEDTMKLKGCQGMFCKSMSFSRV